MGRRVRFETPSSNRSIGQWWTQEAKPVLTRMYGKFKSQASKANTAGDVVGQAVQQAAEELAGIPFVLLVCVAEWEDKMVELNVDQMIDGLEDANKKMGAMQKRVLI